MIWFDLKWFIDLGSLFIQYTWIRVFKSQLQRQLQCDYGEYSKAMRNCFFYAITSYAEFRISVITNQRKYTEINPISEPT